MSQKSRERERQRRPNVKPDPSKCARVECQNKHDGFRHRDTGLWYCAECARLINKENNYELVVQPAPMDHSLPGLMALLMAAGRKAK